MSIHQSAQQINFPSTLGLRAYKIQLVQALKPHEHQSRCTFGEWVEKNIAAHATIHLLPVSFANHVFSVLYGPPFQQCGNLTLRIKRKHLQELTCNLKNYLCDPVAAYTCRHRQNKMINVCILHLVSSNLNFVDKLWQIFR